MITLWSTLTLLLSLVSAQAQSATKDVVHIIFTNHLDIGFDGVNPLMGYDNVVLNKYFHWYFPLAARLGAWFDEREGEETHIYTAHAYVVSLFLDCPPGMGLQCPSQEAREEFVQAVKKGYITWTALPFNAQLEMMDEKSLRATVQITKDVDKLLGMPHKYVMSQRDVPGLTRAAIPVLVGSGVRAISVGVNEGSAPPGVPANEAFVWSDPETRKDVIAFWHPRGYGGYLGTDTLTPGPDCVKTPRDAEGRRDILCFSWREDNQGPYPDPGQVLQIYDLARAQFPGAEVKASTFEAFLDRLEPFKKDLQVLTGEIGDTWIYGIASDPVKVQQYRALQRLRSQCIAEQSCDPEDAAFRNFTRILLKVPEHTWGLDSVRAPGTYTVWSNDDFRAALKDDPRFANAEHSWQRQLNYVKWSLEALHHGGTEKHQQLLKRAQNALAATMPSAAPAAPDTDRASLTGGRQRTSCSQHLSGGEVGAAATDVASSVNVRRLLADGAHDATDSDRARVSALPTASCKSEPAVIDTDHWHIEVDRDAGAIVSLYRKWRDTNGVVLKGTDWAANGTFGQILYATYSEDYCVAWDARYNPINVVWPAAFCKPGAEKAGAKDRTARAVLQDVTQNKSDGGHVLHLSYSFEDWSLSEAGAPPSIVLTLHAQADSRSLQLDVTYHDKKPTRLPEAMYVRFAPDADVLDAQNLKMAKIGAFISPNEVMTNGSYNQHVTMDAGVVVPSKRLAWESLQVASLDAGLLVVGEPQILPDFEGPAHPEQGFNWNLFNNMWGTNYVMWLPYNGNGASVKFRFIVTVRDGRDGSTLRTTLSEDQHFSNDPVMREVRF